MTTIADALALWNTIKGRAGGEGGADGEEEYEDDQGNVYNKKTWFDLKRQGLV